jgi:hypothetical protein
MQQLAEVHYPPPDRWSNKPSATGTRNEDLVGNNTPAFFLKDLPEFSDLNAAGKKIQTGRSLSRWIINAR